MKVMTFNLRTDNLLDIRNPWNKRASMVYKVINQYDCDIIGVQELKNNMLKVMEENLENYTIVGEARTKKFFSERNDILIKKEHIIKEYNTFWLSKNPDQEGSSQWHSLFPRICTTALVKLKEGAEVRVYNTHLDCLSPWAREFGLKKISQVIEKNYDKENTPVILMGDFNANPTSKIIRNFTGGIYSKKNFIAVQEFDRNMYNESTMSKFKGNSKGMHIDYIFLSEEFNIKGTEIIKYNEEGKYPSDHYPLMAEIEIKY